MPGTGLSESWRKRIGDVVVNYRESVITALIDRPAARNAISVTVIDGLDGAVQLAREHDARLMVIRGSGGTFCAGADLRELDLLRRRPEQAAKFMARLGDIFDRLETAPFPVIAVVEGYAVAGGLELLLACDIVIASETARIGDRHLEYGLVPAAGSSVRLTHRLPPARAAYLLLSADLLTGTEAATWGLVTRAVPPPQLEPLVEQMAARLASRSKSATSTVKTMTRNARALPVEQALRDERALFLRHVESRDAAEGLAAFLEHRTPVFTALESSQEGHDT
jgi:enoyl-CoA hydratase/carnithine racemase